MDKENQINEDLQHTIKRFIHKVAEDKKIRNIDAQRLFIDYLNTYTGMSDFKDWLDYVLS